MRAGTLTADLHHPGLENAAGGEALLLVGGQIVRIRSRQGSELSGVSGHCVINLPRPSVDTPPLLITLFVLPPAVCPDCRHRSFPTCFILHLPPA